DIATRRTMGALVRRARRPISQRSFRRQSEEWNREHRDPEENAATALPTGEHVDWPAFWIAELYAPSHARKLFEGLKKLGPGDAAILHRFDAADWARDARPWTGGFLNLGPFSRSSRGFSGGADQISLPESFHSMQAELRQIASGVTVLVMQF